MRPRIGISSGATPLMTPARSNALIPRAANVRLMERPRCVLTRRGSERFSYRTTENPRRANIKESKGPAKPAPTILTGLHGSGRIALLPCTHAPGHGFVHAA